MEISGPLLAILLAFTRVISFLYVIPLFRSKSTPVIVKAAISLSVALMVHDQILLEDVVTLPAFLLLILMQIGMGLTLGFVVTMIFAIPQIAGSLIDMDMGFSSSSVIDPANGQRITVMANLYNILFMLIFVLLNGIESLVYGIILSFHFTEVVLFTANLHFLETLLLVFQYMLVTGVQIALPIIAAMFILNVLLLIIGKVAPQLNILQNMFPIKIAFGLLFVYFSIGITGEYFTTITENMTEHYLDVLESMFHK